MTRIQVPTGNEFERSGTRAPIQWLNSNPCNPRFPRFPSVLIYSLELLFTLEEKVTRHAQQYDQEAGHGRLDLVRE